MNKIVLATGNQGKVNELSNMLAGKAIEIVPQNKFAVSDAEETGTTFVENAIIKARHAAKITGLPAIADDSGLAVDYLNGAPGIYSARYAGMTATDADNIVKLLAKLKNVDVKQRSAQFHCVLVFMKSHLDPTPVICHGIWHGQIAEQPLGIEGFGYDPIFWLPELNKTAAQLLKSEKNALSHRGQALRQLITLL